MKIILRSDENSTDKATDNPAHVLVIQNDELNYVRLIGDWLAEQGLTFSVVPAHEGAPIPTTLDDYAGLIVLGGPQDAHDAPDGTPGAPWFPELKQLIRSVVAAKLPYLGICLGSQLLADATGGQVRRCANGPEIGAKLIAKRDAAATDRLFGPVPLIADVLQWHIDEVVALPAEATVLAASPHSAVQAFRLGSTAWGLQFHYEYDGPVMRKKVDLRLDMIRALGWDPEEVYTGVVDRFADVERVWRPFTHRFGAVCQEYAHARAVRSVAKPRELATASH